VVEEKVDELLWREGNQSLLEGIEAAAHLVREEVHRLKKRRDDKVADDEDKEVGEASWWRAWPLLLLLLAMVTTGKADRHTNSEVSLMLRLRRESPNASPNEFLRPPPLSPPAAVSDLTPWNDFCNESMEQEK
jgi:hypothetical protein